MEKNEFQNRVPLFSNFLGAAILNNRDVSWLLYCFDTKSVCLITKWHGNFENKNKRFYNLCFEGKRTLLV